jgi:hypothetical protein
MVFALLTTHLSTTFPKERVLKGGQKKEGSNL